MIGEDFEYRDGFRERLLRELQELQARVLAGESPKVLLLIEQEAGHKVEILTAAHPKERSFLGALAFSNAIVLDAIDPDRQQTIFGLDERSPVLHIMNILAMCFIILTHDIRHVGSYFLRRLYDRLG